MNLSFDQIHTYFAKTLAPQRIGSRDKLSVRCPFHDDKTESMTLFLTGNGGFNCHACNAKGNVFQFEARLKNCNLAQAEENVASLTGLEASFLGSGARLTNVYDYRQANHRPAFQKRRYAPPSGEKTFRIFRPDENHGWISGIGNQPRVLYHLPEVITANVVIVCEGEKDCETVDALNLYSKKPEWRVATTTNFDGAWEPGRSPKWLASYNPYLAGKYVLIFEDNDPSGRCWAEHVADSALAIGASAVRIIRLPNLPEKGDVTDWMKTHTADELRDAIHHAPYYLGNPQADAPRDVLISAADFLLEEDVDIDWLIEGVVERGSNGFMAADPKAGKSFLGVDMLLSMASGVPWLEFRVPRPVRVAYISREDNPQMTRRRIKRLYLGKGCSPELVEQNFWLNTVRQMPTMMLDNEAELVELIAGMKRRDIEFALLDVFNLLHEGDENDNKDMRRVLENAKRIQREVACSVGIIHHFNKAQSGSITQRLRGSSAISGFAEWIMGISLPSLDDHTLHRIEWEIKADQAPTPKHYHISNSGQSSVVVLSEQDHVTQPKTATETMSKTRSRQAKPAQGKLGVN